MATNPVTLTSIPACTCWAEWQRCFCDAPPTLNTLRRAFTALLRWAYADVTRFDGFADAAGCLTYSADAASSNLSIDPGSTVDPGNTENIPGILVKLDDGVQFRSVAMSPETAESFDTSNFQQVVKASTRLTILCRHWDADICCLMGDISLLFLFSMRPRLFDTWWWLLDYMIESQTEPKLTTAGDESVTKWYESNVVIPITYEYNTFISRESKRLKDFMVIAGNGEEDPRKPSC